MKVSLLLSFFLTGTLLCSLPYVIQGRKVCDEEAVKERVACFDTDGPCAPLPIPSQVFQNNFDQAKGYSMDILRPGMYAIGDGNYFFMIVLDEVLDRRRMHSKKGTKKGSKVGSWELTVIDFPEGPAVTASIDEVVFEMFGLDFDDISKVQMVFSHAHMDHVGGATNALNHFQSWRENLDIDIIAHHSVFEEYEERIAADFFSGRAPLPTVLIDEDVKTFKVGDSFEFSLTPARGHSSEKDLIVFFEKTKGKDGSSYYPAVMMFVDVVFPGWAPFFSFAITTSLFEFRDIHQTLLDDFDLGEDGVFVGGHLSKLGNRADILLSAEFTDSVLEGARVGLTDANIDGVVASTGVFDPESDNFGNSWLLLDRYFDQVVKICAKQVVADFGCVLAAVDVTIESHCRTAQSFVRVDY